MGSPKGDSVYSVYVRKAFRQQECVHKPGQGYWARTFQSLPPHPTSSGLSAGQHCPSHLRPAGPQQPHPCSSKLPASQRLSAPMLARRQAGRLCLSREGGEEKPAGEQHYRPGTEGWGRDAPPTHQLTRRAQKVTPCLWQSYSHKHRHELHSQPQAAQKLHRHPIFSGWAKGAQKGPAPPARLPAGSRAAGLTDGTSSARVREVKEERHSQSPRAERAELYTQPVPPS